MYIAEVIIGAEQLYITGEYSRQVALDTVLHTFIYSNPELHVFSEVPVYEDMSLSSYFMEHNEKVVVGVFMTLLLVGCVAGIVTLFFPDSGFLNTESLVGSVSTLYSIR